MSRWCEFGSVDSDKEIVIHVGKILEVVDRPKDITFMWLSGRLNMHVDEMWASLVLTKNAPFVAALYTAQAAEWGYEIADPNAKGDSPFVNGDDPRPRMLPMPRSPSSPHEALRWLHDGRAHSDWSDWPLPPEELWLPKHIETMTYMPAIDAEQASHRRKCIAVGVAEPQVAVAHLRAANLRLLGAIEASERRIQKEMARVALIQKMMGLVELQVRYWRHPWNPLEPPTAAEWLVRYEHVDRLLALDVALKRLLRRTVATLEDSADQDSAADALLDMLATSGPLGTQLAAFFDQLAKRSTTISAQLLDDVVKALCESFALLSRSSRAEVFLRDHLLSILEGFCEHLPDGIDAVIADLEDERLRKALTDDWRDFFAMTRRIVGKGPTSPLAALGRIGEVHRTLLKIPTAALHDAFLARFFAILHRSHDPEWKVLSSTANFLLRFLSCHGVQHRGNHATLAEARQHHFGELMDLVVADRMQAPKDWQARGRSMNKTFNVEHGFAYRPVAGTLALLTSVVALLLASESDGMPPHVHGLNMVAGLADTASSLAGTAQTLALRMGRGTLGLYEVASVLGGIGSAVGMVGAFFAAYEDGIRGNTYRMCTDLLSGAASGFSGAAWAITLFTNSSTAVLAAGCCAGIGVAVAAVAFAATLLESELRAGTEQLLDVYWDQIDARTSPAQRCPEELRVAQEALNVARDAGGFTPFSMSVGNATDPYEEGPPTFLLAHALGFECGEIEYLFNVREAVITAHTPIRPVDYSKVVQ